MGEKGALVIDGDTGISGLYDHQENCSSKGFIRIFVTPVNHPLSLEVIDNVPEEGFRGPFPSTHTHRKGVFRGGYYFIVKSTNGKSELFDKADLWQDKAISTLSEKLRSSLMALQVKEREVQKKDLEFEEKLKTLQKQKKELEEKRRFPEFGAGGDRFG